MLVTSKETMEIADRGQFAVGAFTVVTREDIQGVVEAAEELDVPVILQAGPFQLETGGLEALASEMVHAAQAASVPVAVQLDHAKEHSIVWRTLRAGFSSVMFDGSLLPFEQNVAMTRAVVEVAREVGVSVEGELGHVGGTEDDITTIASGLTDPDQAAEFAEATGVDALAVAIGTVHGTYKSEPNIDLARLEAIKERVKVPLVLHGGSNLSESILKSTIERGIRKINIGFELKLAHLNAVKAFLEANPDAQDPRHYLPVVRESAKALAAKKMRIFSGL